MTRSAFQGARGRRGRPSAPLLPLALPEPSALPGRIKPEQAVPCLEPFDSEAWRWTIDWDGLRALLFVSPGGGVHVQAESLRDVTALLPELAGSGAACGGHTAVLDGVVAVLDPEGRPDLGALALRLAAPRRSVAGRTPVVFLATDLLHLDGASLLAHPLDRRLDALAATVQGDHRVMVGEHIAASGVDFAEACAERGIPAVLGRRRAAGYSPGIASRDRLRVLLERRLDAVVVGALRGGGGEGAPPVGLVLGEYDGGRLVPCGRVEASWPQEMSAWLARRATSLRTDVPPVDPAAAGGEPVTWLRPRLVAGVRHGGRDASGMLRFAVVEGLLEDRDPTWCVRRSPLPAPVEPSPLGRRFRPTVLSRLPFPDA